MEIRYKLRGENHKDSPQNIKILNERTNLTSRDVRQDIHKFCYFFSERSLLPQTQKNMGRVLRIGQRSSSITRASRNLGKSEVSISIRLWSMKIQLTRALLFNSLLRKAFPNGFLFESVANGGIPANIATPDLQMGFNCEFLLKIQKIISIFSRQKSSKVETHDHVHREAQQQEVVNVEFFHETVFVGNDRMHLIDRLLKTKYKKAFKL